MYELNKIVHDLTMLYLSKAKILTEEINFNTEDKSTIIYAKLYVSTYNEIESGLLECFKQKKGLIKNFNYFNKQKVRKVSRKDLKWIRYRLFYKSKALTN